MQNRLTIKDIARLSGVGKSTVSRVLNNESGVSERTRERVEAVMNQHGFSPSRSARAMRGQSDKVVAIIVSRLDSLSENLAVQTMLPAFYEQGYDPIMMESQFSPQLVEEHLGMLQRRNIDGVVLFGFTGIKDEMLKPWQPSLVMMARDAHGFASVCYDDEGAIITLMQRLFDEGHRHISFLGVPHADVTTGKRRHEAYLAFCKKHNLSAVASLPGLGMKQGYEQVASVLTPQTTALVCATDTLALGASKYLQEQRIDGLQVASVGSTPLMKFLHPEIITVDPGYAESGRQAAAQLIEQINGRSEPRRIVIPAHLS
ncbi:MULTISPECIES: trehalose operon repressor TreR [Enterobacter]|jgi:LacI family trehalose operon transcriptional repressor|uniref:HTH-type transcriptional regulator TreR n=3 Tax=Enterobacter TaxID=547 RepID=A0A330GMD3_ENTCL|nr:MULTISPECIES: trehalose operon repressor TreR [Enterobacter]NBC78008.1 HTH-type transcriptional regulator TreR [Enterobacter asburiae]PNL53668.1 HTH-type transcriptional regulator TreR [Enterobacter hormaechei]HCR0842189.1 HTH-type transcriptional regulator TreR [Enterobacter cancerogenus]EKX4010697.1 HTH-type transcriptional regulator TreR [Enterobacter cloacae]ELV3045308.1 HTH-type transcriptional regulator TreR [Enterobacter chengduensis]